MLDIHGKTIRAGDRLNVGGAWTTGVVVCSIDTGDYLPSHPEADWSHLGRGVLVETDAAGLIHYAENTDKLEIIAASPIGRRRPSG